MTNTSEVVINTHHSSSSLWSNCRPDLQRRINALLNYQAEYFRLRVEFHRQLQELQYVYSPQFERIFERRGKIIDGSSEPTEREKQINWSNQTQSVLSRHRSIENIPEIGIPDFWLIVLKNLSSYDYPIQSRDELCLKYLIDIRCILNPPTPTSSSFTLEFHFLPANPFFHETVLTKTYTVRIEFDESNPYQSYDGPEIDHCYGCSITWKSNHNLTNQKRYKRVRNKSTGQIRLIRTEESIKSFFDFFSPPLIPSDGIQAMTDEDQIRLEADIELGLLLKQRVLPKAIFYYTDEVLPIFDEDEESILSESSQ